MLDLFKRRMENHGNIQAKAYQRSADVAIDKTFKRDPAYREVLITHAPSGIYSKKMDAKFSIHTRRSVSGDSEDYFVQFRPGVDVPVGSYIDIPDNNDVLQRWLIVLKDDRPQFPMYYVLKCNWVLKWKFNDVVYKCQCVQRTQSSYNSGLWTDYTMTTVENQTIMLVPTTPYTQMLSYGQRVIINDEGRLTPIIFKVSKIMDTIPVGLTRLTFAQDVADLCEDCGKYGIANFCTCVNQGQKPDICKNCNILEPKYIDAGLEMPEEESIMGRIVYTGKNATLRVGGKDKVFTSEFWDDIDKKFVSEEVIWKASFMDIDELLCSIEFRYNATSGWQIVLADDSPSGIDIDLEFDDNNGCNVRCFSEENDILVFNIEPFEDNWQSINIKLAQLYSMVGKKIALHSYNRYGHHTEEIILEVIS